MSHIAKQLRVNPSISRLACSLSGRAVDPGGFVRPVGLCSCCPPPGKPVVRSFAAGLDHVQPVESKGTVADGLDVPGAIMGHGILGAIRRSNGTAVAVNEDAIVDAFSDCGRHGVAVGYESAATLAALRALRADGVVAEGSRVLLLLTASHLIPLAQASLAVR